MLVGQTFVLIQLTFDKRLSIEFYCRFYDGGSTNQIFFNKVIILLSVGRFGPFCR